MALSVVATPIGNTQDITLRALDVLESAELILAEDTRKTKQLLARYADRTFRAEILRLDDHVRGERFDRIVDRIVAGAKTAIVSCAGTPGVSDPGESVVAAVVARNHQSSIINHESVAIVPIPGPSALATIVSVADFVIEPLGFYGFLPHKKGRQSELQRLKDASGKHGLASAVFYESPFRVQRLLRELTDLFGPETRLVVGRELTKLHEEVWHGTLIEAMSHFAKPKGEFTILVQVSR